jgi:hypothetical protein
LRALRRIPAGLCGCSAETSRAYARTAFRLGRARAGFGAGKCACHAAAAVRLNRWSRVRVRVPRACTAEIPHRAYTDHPDAVAVAIVASPAAIDLHLASSRLKST